LILKTITMGKIILKFDSNEEADDARDALDGYKWKLVVWDIDQQLRASIKYDEKINPEVREAFENLRDDIRSILSGYKIQME
jgi:hypothetical protein